MVAQARCRPLAAGCSTFCFAGSRGSWCGHAVSGASLLGFSQDPHPGRAASFDLPGPAASFPEVKRTFDSGGRLARVFMVVRVMLYWTPAFAKAAEFSGQGSSWSTAANVAAVGLGDLGVGSSGPRSFCSGDGHPRPMRRAWWLCPRTAAYILDVQHHASGQVSAAIAAATALKVLFCRTVWGS